MIDVMEKIEEFDLRHLDNSRSFFNLNKYNDETIDAEDKNSIYSFLFSYILSFILLFSLRKFLCASTWEVIVDNCHRVAGCSSARITTKILTPK